MKRSHSVRKCERSSRKQHEEDIRNAVDHMKLQQELHDSSTGHSSKTGRNPGSSNTGHGLPHNSMNSAGRGQKEHVRHMHQPSMHDGRSSRSTGNNPPQRVQSVPLRAGMARGSSRQRPCDNTYFMSKPGPSGEGGMSQGRFAQLPRNAAVSQAAELRQYRQIGPSHSARRRPSHNQQPVQPIKGQERSKKPVWQENSVPQSNRHRTGFSQGPHLATPCFQSSKVVVRKWSPGRSHWHGQNSFRFKVVSYNVLADHLLHSNKNLYRSVESPLLEWEYRKNNLMQELLHYQADILCLQEVQEEHFHDWFEPKLEKAGYSGLYKKRTGDKPDGCATFFKISAFTLVSCRLIEFKKEGIPLMDRDNIAIIALLKPSMHHAGSTVVAVANTHLLFNKKRGDIKLAQLACLCAELDEISEVPPPRTSSRRGSSGGDTPHTQHYPLILCGDFNCTPFNPLYDFVTKGKLNYHGLSKMALSGQSFQQHFPHNSLLFTNVIPWELGISLTCKKQKGPGDVSTPSQQDCISEANQRVQWDATNVGNSCPGSEITPMLSCASLPLGNSDRLAMYKLCTSIEHGLQLQSVYQHYFSDGQAEVTTFHDSACCTVDYIHFSAGAKCHRCKGRTHSQLELAGKLTLLTEEQIYSFGGLPCRMLSSDHLSLGAVFVLHV